MIGVTDGRHLKGAVDALEGRIQPVPDTIVLRGKNIAPGIYGCARLIRGSRFRRNTRGEASAPEIRQIPFQEIGLLFRQERLSGDAAIHRVHEVFKIAPGHATGIPPGP